MLCSGYFVNRILQDCIAKSRGLSRHAAQVSGQASVRSRGDTGRCCFIQEQVILTRASLNCKHGKKKNKCSMQVGLCMNVWAVSLVENCTYFAMSQNATAEG